MQLASSELWGLNLLYRYSYAVKANAHPAMKLTMSLVKRTAATSIRLCSTIQCETYEGNFRLLLFEYVSLRAFRTLFLGSLDFTACPSQTSCLQKVAFVVAPV